MDDTLGAFGGFGEAYAPAEELGYYDEQLKRMISFDEEICRHECHDIPASENPCGCRCDKCDCIFCNECKRSIVGDYYEDHIKECGGSEE